MSKTIMINKIHVGLLLCAAFLAAMYTQWSIWVHYYWYDGDTSIAIYWLNSIRLDRYGFNNGDLMSAYAKCFISPGAKAVYWLGHCLCDPIILMKIIPVVTSVLCCGLVYEIGRILRGHACGLFAGLIFILTAWVYRYRQMFGSADAEEFSHVLLLLFLCGYLKKRYVFCSILLAVQAFFYPPLFILSFLSLIVFYLYRRMLNRERRNMAEMLMVAVTGFFSAVFLFYKYQYHSPGFLGRALRLSEIKNMEDFMPGGRNAIFSSPDTVWTRFASDVTGIGLDAPKVILIAVIVLICLFFYKKNKKSLAGIPELFWILFIVGGVLTLAANFLMFLLYEPSRFVQSPMTFLCIIVASVCLYDLRCYFSMKGRRMVGNVIALVFFVFLSAMLIPRFGSHSESAEFRDEIKFLQTLPEGVFIAGHPIISNGVGLYAKRRIFLSYKISTEVYWLNFYNLMTERTRDFFDAYYADSLERLRGFYKKYGVTHLIVEPRHFSEEYLKEGNFFFRPFNGYVKQLLDERRHFYLPMIPEKYIAFRGRSFYVIDLAKLMHSHG